MQKFSTWSPGSGPQITADESFHFHSWHSCVLEELRSWQSWKGTPALIDAQAESSDYKLHTTAFLRACLRHLLLKILIFLSCFFTPSLSFNCFFLEKSLFLRIILFFLFPLSSLLLLPRLGFSLSSYFCFSDTLFFWCFPCPFLFKISFSNRNGFFEGRSDVWKFIWCCHLLPGLPVDLFSSEITCVYHFRVHARMLSPTEHFILVPCY